MCSHISVVELRSKRGMTVKNINFVLVQMSHSLKVPYASNIFFGGRWGAFSKFEAFKGVLIRSGALI